MLNSNERTVLEAIAFNDFQDGAMGRDAVGNEIWSDCIYAGNIDGKRLSGTVSSLSKKGMIDCYDDGKDNTLSLTETGAAEIWPEAFGGEFHVEG